MSDFYNKYPYTDFHELNLDWVIERVKKLTEDWLATQEAWNNTQEQWQQLYDYVHDYFDNLDVQDEINNKINAMISDGTFLSIVAPTINQTVVDTTTAWLAAHITQPTTPAIDNTLSIAGAAADAKAAGDAIDECFQARTLPVGATTLASLDEIGIYHFDATEIVNFTDLPADAAANGTSTLYNITSTFSVGRFIIQNFLQFDGLTRIRTWQRLTRESDSAVIIPWFKPIDNDIITNLCFRPRTVPAGSTTLASLTEMGVYHFASAEIGSFSDIPSDASNAATSTLVNHCSEYAVGRYTEQTFMQIGSGKINTWKRIINTSDGTVVLSWYDIDGEHSKFFQSRTVPAGTTTMAALTDLGIYHFETADMSSFTDLPADAALATSTLICYNTFYSVGRFTEQVLKQLPDKTWVRLVNTSTHAVVQDWKNTCQTYDMLYGKKLVTAGDSYTRAHFTGAYAAYDGKNFGYYIAQRNNMAFTNSGISGSTMAVPTDLSDRAPFSVSRYQDVPADTDYLTIWFGINDEAYCTLGTISDNTNATFYGAWNVVLEYYLTNRPFMKVLIVVTTGADASFRQAIRDVAEKWGYPYLDWEKDVMIPAFFDREGMSNDARDLRRNAFGWNGPAPGHPNPEWHEYASTIFETKLRSI